MDKKLKQQTNNQFSRHEQVDDLAEAFERSWNAGERPRIEDFLSRSDANRTFAFRELLTRELKARHRQGEKPSPDEYLQRFPKEREQIDALFSTKELSTVRGSAPEFDTVSYQPHAARAVTTSSIAQKITALGRYQLLEILGTGGFGAVFRAHDRELRREVAIKIPREGVLDQPQEVKRFMREAVTAARLNHPNICRVYDLGQVDGTPYIVMSLIQGESLKALLARNSLKPRQAVYATCKLAAALADAHRHGIIHRDLKPSNIMVDAKRREPLVLDFGLARHIDPKATRLTISGEILGTPAYMSPEQVRGQISKIGSASDIYSLGAILYEMLAGCVPFDGSVAEVFAKILYEEPVPPSMCRPSVSYALDPICLKALAKSPEDRYESMEEFALALSQFLKKKDSNQQRDSIIPKANLEGNDPASEIPVDPLAAVGTSWEFPGPVQIETTSACPSCQSPLPSDTLLCAACGFHKGLNQRFDVLSKGYAPTPTENPSWLERQLGDEESVKGFVLVAGALILIVSLILVATLFRTLGAWSLLILPISFCGAVIVIGKLSGLPMGPRATHLYLRRLMGWRSLWRPTRLPKSLDMRDAQMTDKDLEKLKPEWGLEVLDLEGTQITNEGLAHLARLETLRILVLRRTSVSKEAVDQLQNTFQGLRIWL